MTDRIYAQNAIRKKHEALNYLKLSSKMDAAASRLDAAIKSQQVYTHTQHHNVPAHALLYGVCLCVCGYR